MICIPSKIGRRFLCSAALFFLLIVGSASTALADCTNDSPATCAYIAVNQTANVAPTSFSANPSCQSITNNNCPNDIMVPIGSQAEWSSFLSSNLVNGGCVTISDCEAYSWQASGWGACSATCGSGVQTQTISCQQHDADTGANITVSNSFCAALPMPATTQACNTQACSSPTPPSNPPDSGNDYTVPVYSTSCDGVWCLANSGSPATDANTLNEICVMSGYTTAVSSRTNAPATCSGCTYAYWIGTWGRVDGKCNSCNGIISVTCQ